MFLLLLLPPATSDRPSYREQIRLMIEVDGHFQRGRARPQTRRHRYRAAVTNAQRRSTASASFWKRDRTNIVQTTTGTRAVITRDKLRRDRVAPGAAT